MLRPSADSSAEESSSSSESDSDAEASPKIPSVALTEAQPVKGSLSDADSSSDEESSSSESEEDIKMEDRSPVVSTGRIAMTFVALEPNLMLCSRETQGGGLSCSPG